MFNSQETILRCLTSIKNQTYKDFEIIIVNDGSLDDSRAIVEDFILENNHLKIILINTENGGVSKARNIAIKLANGNYIAFLDSDDEWDVRKLSKQMNVIEEDNSITLLGCNRNNEVVDSFYKKKFSRLTKISSKLLLYKNFFATPTVIFRKDVIAKIGLFDEKQKFMEDCNYWMRICKDGNCVLLNESYVITGGGKPHFGHIGLSSNLIGMQIGDLKNMKDAYNLGIVKLPEYIFLVSYSIVKFLRRLVIIMIRRIKN